MGLKFGVLSESTVKQCVNCPEDKIKIIYKHYGRCGEACVRPYKYYLLKLIKPGINKCENNAECCKPYGYSQYIKTVVFGAWWFKFLFDSYENPAWAVKK